MDAREDGSASRLVRPPSSVLRHLKVRRAVSVTVKLAPLPAVTWGRTQAVASVTCMSPAAVNDSAVPEGLDRVK